MSIQTITSEKTLFPMKRLPDGFCYSILLKILKHYTVTLPFLPEKTIDFTGPWQEVLHFFKSKVWNENLNSDGYPLIPGAKDCSNFI